MMVPSNGIHLELSIRSRDLPLNALRVARLGSNDFLLVPEARWIL